MSAPAPAPAVGAPTSEVMRVSSRDESDKDVASSPKGEKLGSEKHHNDGLANEGLSPDILGKRLDAIGVNSVYERKVYILNRVRVWRLPLAVSAAPRMADPVCFLR